MDGKTIGYYDGGHSFGGTARYLVELLGALDRRRFRPVFFAIQDYPWHSELRTLDVEVVTAESATAENTSIDPVPSRTPDGPECVRRRPFKIPAGLAWSAGLARDLRELARLFRRRPVDLLHTNDIGAELAPIAARLAGIPRVIGTWHIDPTCDVAGSRGGLRYRLLERASMLALHHAISVSHATKRDWLQRCKLGSGYGERVTVIPNGIDPERVKRHQTREAARLRLGIPEGTLLIGSLGRLEVEKGYEYLVRSVPQIVASEPRARLLIAGRGSLETKLRELAAELGVANHVQLPGFVAEVRGVLECLDIYIQPSLAEAQGLGVLEAMALGLPVIASAVGGLSESIDHGVTGYLVPPREPALLAQTAGHLLYDPALREEMGQRGRARVLGDFTRERMVAETVTVYEQVLRCPRFARGQRLAAEANR